MLGFAWTTEGDVAGYALAGWWKTGGYDPYVPGNNDNSSVTLGSHDASNPLMQGITSLKTDGHADPTLAPGGTRVALWNTGQEAIAYKRQAVSVNAYVGDECTSCSWSGDFARVALNAVKWLGPRTLSVARNGTGSGSVASTPLGSTAVRPARRPARTAGR